MTVLSPPREPLIEQALADARAWTAGRVIDDRPALVHAVRVAVTLGDHVPDPAPTLVAACLLHDAPEFAPPDIALDAVISQRYGAETLRIIRALEVEHHALDTDPIIDVTDQQTLLASTADKIVAIGSLLRRSAASGDRHAFFTARPVLVRLLPHFDAFTDAGAGLVPDTMTARLRRVLGQLHHATASVT